MIHQKISLPWSHVLVDHESESERIILESRDQANARKYVILQGSKVLTKSNVFVEELEPRLHSIEHLENTRFDTKAEALRFWETAQLVPMKVIRHEAKPTFMNRLKGIFITPSMKRKAMERKLEKLGFKKHNYEDSCFFDSFGYQPYELICQLKKYESFNWYCDDDCIYHRIVDPNGKILFNVKVELNYVEKVISKI